MIGVLAHDAAQPKGLGEFLGIALQLQHHPGAALGLGLLHRELVLAPGAPARTLLRTRLARQDRDLVGDHEHAVEADAELADELRVLLLVPGQRPEELGGPRTRDRSQVLDDLPTRHADAVVGDRERLRVGVEIDTDPQLGIVAEQLAVRERREAELVDGVRRVGDEFPQENLPVRVQGVHHEVQELLGFGLEAQGFGGHCVSGLAR